MRSPTGRGVDLILDPIPRQGFRRNHQAVAEAVMAAQWDTGSEKLRNTAGEKVSHHIGNRLI